MLSIYVDSDTTYAQSIDWTKQFCTFQSDQPAKGLKLGIKYRISTLSITAVADGASTSIDMVIPDGTVTDGK